MKGNIDSKNKKELNFIKKSSERTLVLKECNTFNNQKKKNSIILF